MILQTIYTEVCGPWSFDHPFEGGKNLQMEPAGNFAVNHLNVDEQIISPDVTSIKPFI